MFNIFKKKEKKKVEQKFISAQEAYDAACKFRDSGMYDENTLSVIRLIEGYIIQCMNNGHMDIRYDNFKTPSHDKDRLVRHFVMQGYKIKYYCGDPDADGLCYLSMRINYDKDRKHSNN